MKITGACLCKKVQYAIDKPFSRFAICYCSRCRKATGSAHASNLFTQVENLRWLSGEDNISRYELPEAERFSKAFCKSCGAPVPCVSRDGKRVIIPAGSLNTDPGIRPDVKIYHQDKADWYDDLDNIPQFDGPLPT